MTALKNKLAHNERGNKPFNYFYISSAFQVFVQHNPVSLDHKGAEASYHVMDGHNVALPHHCFKKITSILYATAKNTHNCRKDIRHWQNNSMSQLHETLSAFPNLSVISLYHHLPVTLITAFQARARHAGYLDYILSVTQAPSSPDKLSTICIRQQWNNIQRLF